MSNKLSQGSTPDNVLPPSWARFGSLGLLVVATLGASGCIEDSDCGICDPDKLVLESISGINYSDRTIHLLTPGVKEGKYFIEDIGACVETPEANNEIPTQNAERGPEEWCKLSPLVSWRGLEFVFNNLLEPTSIELVRKQPTNPNLFEVYDWKSKIAHIEGPITRYNGDYRATPGDDPDTVTRGINLTCIDNLAALGQSFDHEVLDQNPGICEGFYEADGRMWPLKMQAEGKTESYRGETDWRVYSCAAPDSGPDTCCSVCDYELSVNVAKYGLETEGGARRSPANALTCDPNGNVYEDCAGFVPFVDREFETNRYVYEWNGSVGEWRVPLSDKIRETHPALRAPGIEPDGLPCQTSADCDAGLGPDSGAACIGVTPEGEPCDDDTAECGSRHCKAEWFVACKDDPNLGAAYCVDRRFKDKGAGACFTAGADFQRCDPDTNVCTSFDAGSRLIQCDTGEFPDGILKGEECCQPALGATTPGVCDPLFLPSVTPIDRYDRDRTLPAENRDCYCGDADGQSAECAALIEKFCTAPWGELERHDGSSNEGAYITRAVTQQGGVIYDPALKGVLYLPADRGNQPRSLVETCAAGATTPDLIEGRNIQDGWRMHDGNFFEKYENFDRGMCSGSEYTVVFAGPGDGEHIVDKVDNTLDELRYTFETPEFHVMPGTGFPTDNLRVGACDDFELKFSNKYDLDPRNLNKIELWQLRRIAGEDKRGNSCDESLAAECWELDRRVAGGLECTNDPDEVATSNGEIVPCLTVDVTLQMVGSIKVLIDSVRFGSQLYSFDENASPEENIDEYGRPVTGRYRMVVPGLETVERFEDLDVDNPADQAAYAAAFHDVCGMPLIASGGRGYTDYIYDFTIDPPRCKEDPDRDGIPLSCDNSRDFPNTDQEDQDQDKFGDVSDLCPLTVSPNATADSDRDGVGNECDTCQKLASTFNLESAMLADARLWVRNIPFQSDFDQDGIGDVCDNCVALANCSIYGPEDEGKTPHTVGVPVPIEDKGVCQTDTNGDMIGDACFNAPALANADGVVGFANEDDFDQDGINNMLDVCPRQPVTYVECDLDGDPVCGGATCMPPNTNGVRVCNHLDSDNDSVGDVCDTCPFVSNPLQVTDAGMQVDDDDGDFVGALCETKALCEQYADPRPYGFFEVSVNGLCCTTSYPGDGEYLQKEDGSWDCIGLCDPDGFPIKQVCADEAIPDEDLPDGSKCRSLPSTVSALPGVINLAPGCQEALDAAGLCAPKFEGDPDCPFEVANRRLTLGDYPDPNELWGKMCFLPQWDQDFDGLGDDCDLCKFQFDPFNVKYTDPNTGKVYPDRGKYCYGDYSPDAVCAAEDAEDTGDTGETGETGGDEESG